MTHKPLLPGALLLASLLLVVGVQATPVSGTLDVESIGSPGPIAASGALVGLVQNDQVGDSAVPSGRFWIHASQVTVEVDQSETAVSALNRTVYYPKDPDTTRDEYQSATVTGTEVRPSFEFYVVPHGGVATLGLESSCGGLAPSDQDSLEAIPKVRDDERPRTVIDTSDALHWTECDRQATAVVTGDFLVALWEHSATLTADNQTVELESGEGQSDTSPNEATDDTVTHDRQVFLYITQGRLELPLEPGVHRDLYLQDADVASANLLQFNGATGNLQIQDTDVDLDQDDLLLDGELTLNAAGHVTRTTLAVVVGGTLTNAHLNGQAVAATLLAPDVVVPWTWITLGILAFLATVAVVAWYLLAEWQYRHLQRSGLVMGQDRGRRRRSRVYEYRALHAANHDHPHQARLFAALALRVRSHAVQPRLLRARANEALHRYRAVLADRRVLHDVLTGERERARNACHAARAAAKIPDPEQAREWLQTAYGLNQVTGMVEAIDPAYDALRDQAWFRDLDREPRARLHLPG